MYSYIKCRSMVRTAVRLTVNETSGNVRRTIKIWECDCIPSPFVLGIFCPQIYIPFRMKEEEQQYILAHESWHIRRHDSLWKLIAFVLLAVYWWNPLAWIAFFYMTRDMEMSCDEAVLAQFGNQIKKDTAHPYLLLRWSGIRIHLPRLRLERQMQEGELRTC